MNLHALCPQIIAETTLNVSAQRSYNCSHIGNYTVEYMISVLKLMDVLLEIDDFDEYNAELQKIDACQGIIVNQNNSHWIAVVKKTTYKDESGNDNHEWIWIDSIESVGKIFIKSDELLKEYFSKKECAAKLFVIDFSEKKGEQIQEELFKKYVDFFELD